MREFGAEKGPDLTDKPWTCPVCNRGIAPGVTECSHVRDDMTQRERVANAKSLREVVDEIRAVGIAWPADPLGYLARLNEPDELDRDIEAIMDDSATELYAD